MQKTKAGRLALLTLLSLLTTSWLGCCLCKVPDRATIQVDANRLDGWRGELQLVVPAEREPRGGILSPNGRWMLVYLGFFGHPKQWILLDLAMETERDLGIESDYFCWLEGDLLFSGGGIINATDLTVKVLEWREDEPDLLAGAKVVYVMSNPSRGGTAAINRSRFPLCCLGGKRRRRARRMGGGCATRTKPCGGSGAKRR